MKKELEYFQVAGGYGGNQDFMKDHWMHIGGCGALTACDSSIYLAKYHHMPHLCPIDVQNISKDNYISFGMQMKPYLRPRFTGIDKTSIYVEGFKEYLKDVGDTKLNVTDFQGTESVKDAAKCIMNQIDLGFPIPFLTLNHRNPKLKDYVWHWYLLNGYDYDSERLLVKAVTYGHYRWIDLEELWDTGHARKGGFILYHL